MKNKKFTMALLCAIVSTIFGVVASIQQLPYFGFIGTDDLYSLTVDANNKPTLNNGYGTLQVGSATFTYENASDYNDGHVSLLSGGTITKDKCNGLSGIVVSFSGDLEVYTAYDLDRVCNKYTLSSGTLTTISGNFIQIKALSATNISSITLKYDCKTESIDPITNRLVNNDTLHFEVNDLEPISGTKGVWEDASATGGVTGGGSNAKYEIPFYVSFDSVICINVYARYSDGGSYPLEYYAEMHLDSNNLATSGNIAGATFSEIAARDYYHIDAGQHSFDFSFNYNVRVDYVEIKTFTVDSLSLENASLKTNFAVNDAFPASDDLDAAIEVKLHGQSLGTKTLRRFKLSEPNMTSAGIRTITVTYGNMSATYNISVGTFDFVLIDSPHRVEGEDIWTKPVSAAGTQVLTDASCSGGSYMNATKGEFKIAFVVEAASNIRVTFGVRYTGGDNYYVGQQFSSSLNNSSYDHNGDWTNLGNAAGAGFKVISDSGKTAEVGLNTYSFYFNYGIDIDYIDFEII